MLACRALTKTLRCGFVPYPGAARPVSHGAWMAVEGPRMFGVEGPGFQKRAKEEQKYHEPHFPASKACIVLAILCVVELVHLCILHCTYS